MSNNQTAQKKYNTSGIVMFIIGVVFVIFSIIDFFLGNLNKPNDIITVCVTTVPFIAGGVLFAKKKVKFHWLLYVVVFTITGIVNNFVQF
ncbi:MAG: hypothetical protein Q4B31_00985 [Clostridia bacterium]|nr:hypothetical protein [Clostridia bacterium]